MGSQLGSRFVLQVLDEKNFYSFTISIKLFQETSDLHLIDPIAQYSIQMFARNENTNM